MKMEVRAIQFRTGEALFGGADGEGWILLKDDTISVVVDFNSTNICHLKISQSSVLRRSIVDNPVFVSFAVVPLENTLLCDSESVLGIAQG